MAELEMYGTKRLLEIEGLSKSFGSNLALAGVSLSVHSGEIHGLIGENGSGKSTLVKILAGYHRPDAVDLFRLHEEEVQLPLRPTQATDLGLSFVHQDLALVPTMTVLENILAGTYRGHALKRIRWRQEREAVSREMTLHGVDISPDARVEALPGAAKTIVAILRARRSVGNTGNGRGRLFVLDEPTSYLPRPEVERLFSFLRNLSRNGDGVLFVTHHLSEIVELCDKVTVLRDGHVVGRFAAATTTPAELIRHMVGHDVALEPTRDRPSDESAAYEVDGLAGAEIRDISFKAAAGEIVGITGLVGAGHDEIPYLLFGAKRRGAGRILLQGRDVDINSPRNAIRAGIVLVPRDRSLHGVIGDASLRENITLAVLDKVSRAGLLRRRREAALVASLISRFRVAPPHPDARIGSLSGGNQQKAILAKWLARDPLIMLLHQPTQGVDVASRELIFQHIRGCAEAGCSVIVCSDDHEELASICHRVIIVSDGRLRGHVRGSQLAAEEITRACHQKASPPVAA